MGATEDALRAVMGWSATHCCPECSGSKDGRDIGGECGRSRGFDADGIHGLRLSATVHTLQGGVPGSPDEEDGLPAEGVGYTAQGARQMKSLTRVWKVAKISYHEWNQH